MCVYLLHQALLTLLIVFSCHLNSHLSPALLFLVEIYDSESSPTELLHVSVHFPADYNGLIVAFLVGIGE